MRLDTNGAVIDNITTAQESVLGPDYIVMWDSDGAPIHINKKVIEYLCAGMYGEAKAPTLATSFFVGDTENIN